MKKFFMIALLTLAGSGAFAAMADQYTVVYDCGPAVIHPDMGMRVQYLTGGIAGIPTIRVTRFFLGHTHTESFFVRAKIADRNVMGAPVTYQGKGIQFIINLTTSPSSPHPATLITKQHGIEKLNCKLN